MTARARFAGAVTAAIAVVLVAGCSTGSTPALPTGSATTAPSSAPPASATPLAGCTEANRRQSYAPVPTSTEITGKMAEIRKRGKLIAAVSADNLLFGFNDPIAKRLDGFDIDMIRSVAVAIFGGTLDTIDSKIEYRVVNFAQRIPALTSNGVDIVADIMTINCTRWSQIAFSAEYYSAAQQVLVAKDSGLNIDKLAGQKVCSAKGSTGSENLQRYPKITPVLVDDISDCMVLFQQGSVQGVVSDNTVVAGFASQDPYAEVSPQKLTDEPYGLGFNKSDTDFVRFVNALLERMRADGAWTALYNKWLLTTLGRGTQPVPAYGR